METIKKVFYWIETIGKYGNALSKVMACVKEQIQEIHPELMNSNKEQSE